MSANTGQSNDGSEPLIETRPTDTGLIKSIAVIAVGLSLDFLVGALFVREPATRQLFWHQDLWLLCAQFILAGAVVLPLGIGDRKLTLSRTALLFMSLLLVTLCYMGHRWLLFGYDFSRDEQMASFDALIYAHGRLAWPLPPEWRADAAALNQWFMLRDPHPVAWVSAYLPMNAAIRAAVGWIADPALTGPLHAGLSLPLVWGCARRLWPDDREAAAVTVLLLAVSGQFVLAGMTAFAMPAHLFFDLLWLRLFLADRRSADFAALVVGLIATGLHQPLFHPMFVAPFLFLLLREGQWRRLGLFVSGYAVICAFWLAWPFLTHALVSGPQSASVAADGAGYLSRLVSALSHNSEHLPLMMENLLRFCTWQHLLLLPLMLASWSAVRSDRMAGALALGFMLPILVMALILPWQGNGFGYRYVHGVLGNAALLGGYGWRRLADWHDKLRPVFIRATAASALVLLPMQAWMARQYYAPSAQASARIEASGADYAVIGTFDALFTRDLVLNRPDLSNRPIRLVAEEIGDAKEIARRICHPGVRVALPAGSFFGPLISYYGIRDPHRADARLPAMKTAFERAGCEVILLR